MSNEKQNGDQQTAADRLAAARQHREHAEVKQPEVKAAETNAVEANRADARLDGDASGHATDRELEMLRLQFQISENNRKAAELAVVAAEKNSRDVMAEAIQKENATVERLKHEREAGRRWREEGPRKFWVHLAHQLPIGTTLDKPALLIGAANEHEAAEKYKTALGIRYTPHRVAVIPAIDGEECPWEEIKTMAENGIHSQQISLGA